MDVRIESTSSGETVSVSNVTPATSQTAGPQPASPQQPPSPSQPAGKIQTPPPTQSPSPTPPESHSQTLPSGPPGPADKASQPKSASAEQPAQAKKAAPATEAASSSKRKALIVGLLVVAALGVLVAGILLGRYWGNSKKDPNHLVLFGNVDLRQVELAFNNSERIGEVLVEEGDKVTRGQVLARLDSSRLRPKVVEAEAEVDAQTAVVQRLHNGSRPEEIAQARANVALAVADQLNADLQWKRLIALAGLTTGRAVSQQDIDNAKAALDMAQARLAVAQKSLDLSTIGPRIEDIAQGEAVLRSNQAQLDLLRRELADAELVSPCDAVVRSRLLEPGEMVSPQRPVFDLSISDPKWIRTYVSEPDLGRIHTGMKASVTTDSFPGRTLSGWIGFISSVAEFTPKAVQTEELRPGLVYEIRVFVKDPQDEIRLGAPATVSLELAPVAQGQP